VELGALNRRSSDLRDAAMPYLAELYGTTHRAVHLSIRDDGDAVVIAAIRDPDESHPDGRVSGRYPAYATAGGLVLLAHAPTHLQEQALDGLMPGAGGQRPPRRYAPSWPTRD
jgi:DNA-binding IclR family transcriptional regulator